MKQNADTRKPCEEKAGELLVSYQGVLNEIDTLNDRIRDEVDRLSQIYSKKVVMQMLLPKIKGYEKLKSLELSAPKIDKERNIAAGKAESCKELSCTGCQYTL